MEVFRVMYIKFEILSSYNQKKDLVESNKIICLTGFFLFKEIIYLN